MVTWVGRGTSQGLQEEYAPKEIQSSGVEIGGCLLFLPSHPKTQGDSAVQWRLPVEEEAGGAVPEEGKPLF